MTTKPDLLPCPFCGGAAECRPDEVGSGGQHVSPYHAGCRSCRVYFTEEESSDAINAWCSRAVAPADPSAEAVAQDFWWLIENRSGTLLYATADSGDKRWTFSASDAARFKTEAAAYNCMVQMRLVFRESNGGYSGENISAQQHGFIYAAPTTQPVSERAAVIDECAMVAEEHGRIVSNEMWSIACSKNIAAAIRALATPPSAIEGKK